MAKSDNKLRIAFIVGGLGKGGAEKQFIYMLRALQILEAEICVILLTRGEYYEQIIQSLGIAPIHIKSKNQIARLIDIHRKLSSFRPHFVQATHFYTSLYAGIAGRTSRATSIGAIRNDFYQDLNGAGRFAPWLLPLPDVFLANSAKGRENALQYGLKPERVYVLPNVIDLDEFDRSPKDIHPPLLENDCIRIATVARLMPVKKLERFLQALALARKQIPSMQGIIVGSGPEESRLHKIAYDLGLSPASTDGGVVFMGLRNDIPQILRQAHLYVLTSDREGFPNVLLEAMAASLPIISTPVGEVREIIVEGENGFIFGYDDIEQMASQMVNLAVQPERRRSMGQYGRKLVESKFSFQGLPGSMERVYYSIAEVKRNWQALSVLRQGQEQAH